MSSGPGILQNQILNALQPHRSYVFQNMVLWELAFARKEIAEERIISKDLKTGYIKKSFQENFRRAVKGLIKQKRVIVRKRKITDLSEALQNFTYFTSKIETHLLRKMLLPSVLEYINDRRFIRRFGISKIEEELTKRFAKRQKNLITRNWLTIERNIASILAECSQEKFELWLNCMARGRYLFLNSRLKCGWALVGICSEIKKNRRLSIFEKETLLEIEELIKSNFDRKEWEIGKLKSIYYSISNMSKRSKGSLDDDVKKYLHEKHENLIKSLPGHKEPKDHRIRFRGKISSMRYGHVVYSPLLDKLLTKQILRNLTFIKIADDPAIK